MTEYGVCEHGKYGDGGCSECAKVKPTEMGVKGHWKRSKLRESIIDMRGTDTYMNRREDWMTGFKACAESMKDKLDNPTRTTGGGSMKGNWRSYERKGSIEATPYVGQDTTGVSISVADKENGSPRRGDMIARNPKNHEDMWLVANEFFFEHYEEEV